MSKDLRLWVPESFHHEFCWMTCNDSKLPQQYQLLITFACVQYMVSNSTHWVWFAILDRGLFVIWDLCVLCMFVSPMVFLGVVVVVHHVPPGGLCRGSICWSSLCAEGVVVSFGVFQAIHLEDVCLQMERAVDYMYVTYADIKMKPAKSGIAVHC